MRLVLSGGGTGGHVYPALAIIEETLREHAEAQFMYIGTDSGLERDIVSKSLLPVKFQSIHIRGFRRKLTFDNMKTIWLFLRGVRRSCKLLREFKPDIVIGTGGYVCAPVIYAAAKLGIPTLIHEQNVLPGLTNRFLSRYVDSVAVSFKQSEKKFPKAKRVLFSGNPRATTVINADPHKGYDSLGLQQGDKLVVIVGGSRGANAINQAVMDMIPYFSRMPDVHFVCVTGTAQFTAVQQQLKDISHPESKQIQVVPYIHNMHEVMAATTLIVNRAGASFLAEITSLGIPAILIPSPNVTNNHQEANARVLEKAQAAEIILERDLNGELLWNYIEQIVSNPIRSEFMSKQSQKLGNRNAAHEIVQEVNRLCFQS